MSRDDDEEEDDDDDATTTTTVIFRDLTAENKEDLRRLNQIIFPVRYTDKFYEDCARAGAATQLAYDKTGRELLGAIACRLEMDPTKNGARLYIMTLGVYAPHRDGRIGSRLLQHALNAASEDAFIHDVYLHVQTNNIQAIEFYERFGFEQGEVLRNYYKRIDPPDAVVLRRDLGASWTRADPPGVTFERNFAA